MYHLNVAAGFDLDDVQFTETVSPILYFEDPPVILGPSVGKTKEREHFIIKKIGYFPIIEVTTHIASYKK